MNANNTSRSKRHRKSSPSHRMPTLFVTGTKRTSLITAYEMDALSNREKLLIIVAGARKRYADKHASEDVQAQRAPAGSLRVVSQPTGSYSYLQFARREPAQSRSASSTHPASEEAVHRKPSFSHEISDGSDKGHTTLSEHPSQDSLATRTAGTTFAAKARQAELDASRNRRALQEHSDDHLRQYELMTFKPRAQRNKWQPVDSQVLPKQKTLDTTHPNYAVDVTSLDEGSESSRLGSRPLHTNDSQHEAKHDGIGGGLEVDERYHETRVQILSDHTSDFANARQPVLEPFPVSATAFRDSQNRAAYLEQQQVQGMANLQLDMANAVGRRSEDMSTSINQGLQRSLKSAELTNVSSFAGHKHQGPAQTSTATTQYIQRPDSHALRSVARHQSAYQYPAVRGTLHDKMQNPSRYRTRPMSALGESSEPFVAPDQYQNTGQRLTSTPHNFEVSKDHPPLGLTANVRTGKQLPDPVKFQQKTQYAQGSHGPSKGRSHAHSSNGRACLPPSNRREARSDTYLQAPSSKQSSRRIVSHASDGDDLLTSNSGDGGPSRADTESSSAQYAVGSPPRQAVLIPSRFGADCDFSRLSSGQHRLIDGSVDPLGPAPTYEEARKREEIRSKQWWNADTRYHDLDDFEQSWRQSSVPDKSLLPETSSPTNTRQPPGLTAPRPAPSVLARAEATKSEATSALLLAAIGSVMVNKNDPKNHLTRWGKPRAWYLDPSPDGNKSFFGSEWGAPPARIGRDPRYAPLPTSSNFNRYDRGMWG